jgi:hypothetical protein
MALRLRASAVVVRALTSSRMPLRVSLPALPGTGPVWALPPVPMARASSSAWVELESGVKYQDVEPGSGPGPVRGEMVQIRFRGELADGTEFDSNLDAKNPLSYRHGRGFVVWGLEEGVDGMAAGGTRKIIVPPHIGYGFKRVGKIPPNSELHFTVTLVAVGEEVKEPERSTWEKIKAYLSLQ